MLRSGLEEKLPYSLSRWTARPVYLRNVGRAAIDLRGRVALERAYRCCHHGATRRSLAFKISSQMHAPLAKSACHYCGAHPTHGASPRAESRQRVLLNGLDRLNSKKGYTSKNVVACCKHCNRAKLGRTVEDFVTHCRAVVLHRGAL